MSLTPTRHVMRNTILLFQDLPKCNEIKKMGLSVFTSYDVVDWLWKINRIEEDGIVLLERNYVLKIPNQLIIVELLAQAIESFEYELGKGVKCYYDAYVNTPVTEWEREIQQLVLRLIPELNRDRIKNVHWYYAQETVLWYKKNKMTPEGVKPLFCKEVKDAVRRVFADSGTK